jgi:hypothetical protein
MKIVTQAATRRQPAKHFVLRSTRTLCGVNMSQHQMYQYKIACEDIMDRPTGRSTSNELLSRDGLSEWATERIAEAVAQGKASLPSDRLLELRNQMERPNQQRGPRVKEQRRQNRQTRRAQRDEAARQHQRPEHEMGLEERKCTRPRCTEVGAIIKHRCRECYAEACGDCMTGGKHRGGQRHCNPDTWERAPTRSDYTTGHLHVGLKIRNKFDDGTRRGEVLGYLHIEERNGTWSSGILGKRWK